ncbi:MAG: hypothetical protein Q8L14_08845 [Myxococcales bacterium]|nr:hypothetical protein [Myxococcales bacterium]
MTPADLEALQARLTHLEEQERRRQAGRQQVKRAALMVGVLGAFVGSVAWAANGNCPNGLPFCFSEDSPAVAVQVNHNFSQLKEWLEQKVGTVGTANVTTTGSLSSASLTATGAVSSASVTTGSLSSSGTATVSGLLTSGPHTVNGDLGVTANGWGSGPTRVGPFNRTTCVPESGVRCPNGQYVCGLITGHTCGQGWFEANWWIECCAL